MAVGPPLSSPLALRRPPPSPRTSPARLAALAFLAVLACDRARAHPAFYIMYPPELKTGIMCAAPGGGGGGGRHRCRLDTHGDRAASLLHFLVSVTYGERCCRREVLTMQRDLAVGARGLM
jgi:hypothetical protein